jgi:hypothetical protein
MDTLKCLTQAFLVKEQKFRKLLIDKTLEFPYQKGMNFLVIYAMGSKLTRITTYPVHTNEVWKYTIVFREINPDTIEEAGKILGSENLIHTTGICEKSNQTRIENYLFPDIDKNTPESLQHNLRSLPEIQGVEFERIFLH